MKQLLDRLAAITTKQALFLGGLLSLLFYMTMFDDGSAIDLQIQKLKQQVTAEQAKEKESDRALSRIKQLKENYTALEEQFRIISTQVPADLQMSEILRTVETLARTSGIGIKGTEPLPVIKTDLLETLPIKLNAEGTFAEAALFLYNISTMERLFRVRSFSINTLPNNNAGKKLSIEAEFASYRFVGTDKEVKK